MPIIRLEDDFGHKMKVLQAERFGESFTLPVLPGLDMEQEIATWDTWEARDEDILLCAYPKSGTHWLWEIASMLLNGSSERIGLIKEELMLEGMTKNKFDNSSSPRILNTHIYYSHLPPDFRKKRCKIIYIMRNPKDLAVSYYNHHTRLLDYGYHAEWKEYLPRYVEGNVDYGSWFDYVTNWDKEMRTNQETPAHFVTYEDLHQGFTSDQQLRSFTDEKSQERRRNQDCVQEIRRLAKFLNVEGSENLFTSIAKACKFDKMKKEKDPLEDSSEWKEGKPGMYRKGQVGDWKHWFTVAQSEMFDKVCTEKLKDVKIPLQYELTKE